MEKSIGVRPGGGTLYPGRPPVAVPRSVAPPVEEVTSYAQACWTIWLHDVEGAS